MNFKQYLSLMAIGTGVALLSWVIVLTAIDPVTAGAPAKLAFYVTFFISSVGIFSLFGALVRVLILHKEAVVAREVARAFRQGILFSSIILLSLVLAAFDYLRWWTILLVIMLFACIELFFLTAGRRDV